jgi:hypothetical protein
MRDGFGWDEFFDSMKGKGREDGILDLKNILMCRIGNAQRAFT